MVRVCVAEVDLRGLQAEGIYRVSGGLDQIQSTRIAFEKGTVNVVVWRGTVNVTV